LFTFGVCNVLGNNPKADSLLALLKTAEFDTTKVNLLNSLFLEYEFQDDVRAKEYLDAAFALSNKIGYKQGIADAHVFSGYFAEDKGDYATALQRYNIALGLFQELQSKKDIADALNYIGIIHFTQGNYPGALKNYFLSLKIKEGLDDKKGAGDLLNNIGLVYSNQNNYSEALKHYRAALRIYEEIDHQGGIALSYNNIGIIYRAQGDFSEALKTYQASLRIDEGIGNKRGIASSYNNIGNVYSDLGNYDEALKNLKVSLKIREDLGDKAGEAGSYINLGDVFIKIKKYQDAEKYFLSANELLKKITNKEYRREVYKALSFLDSVAGDYKGAYTNHKLYILYRDSLDNEETRKQTIQSQMSFDFEKKEAIAVAEHKKELESQQVLAEEKNRKQKIIILFVICGLLFVLAFAGFIFRSLRITRKQKDTIEKQKDLVEQQKIEVEQQKALVEEHQKAIIDSITYARRIQHSQLPAEKYIDQALKRLNRKTDQFL
jgi:tetratricopeptide (TPR) repeat protein